MTELSRRHFVASLAAGTGLTRIAGAAQPAVVDALHGWCVPDNHAARNTRDAERAWRKLVALYLTAL